MLLKPKLSISNAVRVSTATISREEKTQRVYYNIRSKIRLNDVLLHMFRINKRFTHILRKWL